MSRRPEPRLTRRQGIAVRSGLLVVAGLLAAGVAVVLTTLPPTASSFYPKCQLHTLTGLHCPGCGLTRFVAALAAGDLSQAAAYNAVTFVMLPVILVVVGNQLWAWLWGVPPRRLFSPNWTQRAGIAFAIGCVVFFVVRNIPVEPFSWLAPHELQR